MNDDIENLDRLADELEGLRVDTPAPGLSRLEPWLRMVADRGASDLLLVAGEPPTLRVNGRIARTDFAPIDGVDVEELVLPELPPYAQRAYRETGLADAARKVPLLASLDLPAGTEALARLPRGLVIVGGATGAGKTTTLAALVDDINRRESKHIITIEDPIEYEHVNHKSIIQQVEIGVDAPDFPTSLRSALRQNPDVIVIGEMREPG